MTQSTQRYVGHTLMWIGFLVAAFVSTRHSDRIDWLWYGLTTAAGVAGIVLLRRAARFAAVDQQKTRSETDDLITCLKVLAGRLSEISAARSSIDVHDLRHRIDGELADPLRIFADKREVLIEAYGLQSYASVMDRFAGAERNINRAWSASADGYIDEAWACLGRAEALMKDALALLESYRREAGGREP